MDLHRSFILHPFKGSHQPGTAEDTFNLKLSAARSSIERCFGQLVLAWQILKKGIRTKDPATAQKIIQCTICLHNLRKRFRCPDQNLHVATAGRGIELQNLTDSVAWVQEHGGDDLLGGRLRADRRVPAIACSLLGTQLRDQLAVALRDSGSTRSGVQPILR